MRAIRLLLSGFGGLILFVGPILAAVGSAREALGHFRYRGDFLWSYQGLLWSVSFAFWLAGSLWFARIAWRLLAEAARGSTESRRRRRGLCPACGYDLTGNQSGTCPECGAAARRRRQS